MVEIFHFDGITERDDTLFDTVVEAREYSEYLLARYCLRSELLQTSDSDDDPFDEDDVIFNIIEVEE